MRFGCFILLMCASLAPAGQISLQRLPEKNAGGAIEIRGVSPGDFDPRTWEAGTLNLVPDVRHPFLEPREGAFRNIYAPSAVQLPTGWRVFYGAWDGVPTGNDRIYCFDTRDFIGIENRRTVIEHGPFQHVCNVNAIRRDDGGFDMVCTAYPDEKGLNKPAFFTIKPDEPARTAVMSDVIRMSGYDAFDGADINGMNVILREAGNYRLYFGNFKDFGKTYRASSVDGKNWTFDGKVLDGNLMVNDVKTFQHDARTWYLMGLHHNGDELLYSLSTDGMKFPPARRFIRNLGDEDRYIVAIGWVVRDTRLLGVLYGAGAKPSLDANRIFARWLQKKVMWVGEDGAHSGADGALGPDRAIFRVKGKGRFQVRAEDGRTKLCDSELLSVRGDEVFHLAVESDDSRRR